MESIPQENVKPPVGKSVAEVIAEEQLRDVLSGTEITGDDFGEERAALLRAQEESERGLTEIPLTKEGRVRIQSKNTTPEVSSGESDVGGFEQPDTNQLDFVKKHLHLMSRQEQRDLSTESWKYWKKRLLPEADILPDYVADAFGRILRKSFSVSDSRLFNSYIKRRRGILTLNVQKRIEMDTLKERLRDTDAHRNYTEEEQMRRRQVFYDVDGKSMFVNEGDKKKPLTYGDIVADMDWGVLYYPNESCPPDIWRRIRKVSDLSETRQKINVIFNDEISTLERIPSPSTNLSEEFIEEHIYAGDSGIQGIIGERMAKNILLRMSYDNPEVLFKVEFANAMEDAVLKYDFKIYIPKKTLGVAIEGDDMPRDEFVTNKRRVGIQFTVSNKGSYIGGKQRQIKDARGKIDEKRFTLYVKRKVDNIVLVSVPLSTYKDCFKQWLEQGKPSGGPEQFLSDEEKNRLIHAVLSSL